MSLSRLWSRHLVAREAFLADPSPRNEGTAIQAYAEVARSMCPEQAAELISLWCRTTAWYVDERSKVA